MRRLIFFLITFLIPTFSCWCMAIKVDDKAFPLRDTYPTATTISHQALANKINDMLIIDVRSAYEFSVLHLSNAINVPVSNLGFIPTLKQLRSNDEWDIVFYCNGVTCNKSYQASVTAQKFGIERVFTFDLGVLNWAKLYPNKSVFFNHSPLKITDLIPPEKFRQHLLLPE